MDGIAVVMGYMPNYLTCNTESRLSVVVSTLAITTMTLFPHFGLLDVRHSELDTESKAVVL